MNTSFSHQNPWFPGFFERMACCALPPSNMNDVIVMSDSQEDSDDTLEVDDLVLDEDTRQPLSQHFAHRSLLPQAGMATSSLPSPTLSPSRRELDRWNPSCMGITTCCTPSYAGSTATTASIMTEEEEYYGCNELDDADEVRSNATTQVVSHRKQNRRRNELLSVSLASAERRLRQQLLEEEARANTLRTRKVERTASRHER